jgi:hypothetical protein
MILRRPLILAALALLPTWGTVGDAKVFYARDELQQLAFPEGTRMEVRDLFLTAEQRRRIEERSRTPLESDLITVYAGYDSDQLLGYAFIDTHVVRTLPETFLIVLAPAGEVESTHVLAFYEPLEYLPSERWLEQFDGQRLNSDLRVGRRIAAITGATLSAEAVNGAMRRALAVYEVILEGH